MGKFFGSIIGTVIARMLMMGAIVGGGQYYLSQHGGIAGLLGGSASGGGETQTISAGIGGLGAIASSLGFGGAGAEADHFEVQGRISAIRVECRLVSKTGRTEPLACDRARTALSYPQFAEYSLSEARTATYIYYALDGVEVLRGKADARRGQQVGDVIDLRIDRADPRRSTPI